MFDNIGGKIKSLAVVVTILGIIASIIYAIILWSQNSYRHNTILLGLGILLGGSLVSWIGSFFMYGFGEMIVRLKSIDEKMSGYHTSKRPTGSSSDEKSVIDIKTIDKWLQEGLITEEEYNKIFKKQG